MTWRIEHADALSLLGELPDGWAQTCVTSPPRTSAPADVLAVLVEVLRVLRTDGTLWLLAHRREPLQDALVELGFHWQGSPRWARPLMACGGARLLVFTKGPSFFCDTRALYRPQQRRPTCASGPSRTRPVSCERELLTELTRRCVLAGSSPVACGICGAPYRRALPGENTGMRCPTCAHNNRAGRCLVLDPFCRPGTPSGEIAHRYGRSFLGVTDHVRAGER